MRHPVFSEFEVLTSNEIPPEFHYGFLGEVRRKLFMDGTVFGSLGEVRRKSFETASGSPTFMYAPGEIRSADYPGLNDEYFEWISVLEAATAATQRFVMIELGAGYGRWLVRAALAVKRHHGDLPIKLIGVEAEPTHFQWLKQHLRDNGIDPAEHKLIEAAVDEKEGEVAFYVGKSDTWYGQAIVDHTNTAPETIQKVRTVRLDSILSSLDSVDLIDLDIQGVEFVVLRSAIPALNEKVKRVYIRTHRHDIERQLRTLFRRNGWYKLDDYVCEATQSTPWGDIEFGDGVQTWINPRLSPIQPTTVALDHLQEVLATSEQREAQLREVLATSKQREADLQEVLATSKQREADLQEVLATSEQREAQLRLDLNHLRLDLNHLQVDLNHLQVENRQLRASLHESEHECAQCLAQLERLHMKNDQKRRLLEKYRRFCGWLEKLPPFK